MNKILVIVAHPDDETFGIAGTLLKLKEQNKQIKVISVCKGRSLSNSTKRVKAFEDIMNIIGCECSTMDFFDLELENVQTSMLIDLIAKEIYNYAPDTVFTVSENDIHQDHKLVSASTKIAARPSRTAVKEIYEFKINGCEPFSSTHFDTTINISKFLAQKLELCNKYTTECVPHIDNFEYLRTIYREIT